jgi:hypothetical protein
VNDEAVTVPRALKEHSVDCESGVLSRLAGRNHGAPKMSSLAAATQTSCSIPASDLLEQSCKISILFSVLVAVAKPRRSAYLDVDDGSGGEALFGFIRDAGGDCQCVAIGPRSDFRQTLRRGAPESMAFSEVAGHRHAGPARDLHMDVDSAALRLEGGSLDLLYIGSLNTVRALRRDFDVWLSKMSTEGIILFRDIDAFATEFGTWRLWRKLKQEYPYIEIGTGARMGVLVVGGEGPLTRLVECSLLSVLDEVNDLFGHASVGIAAENDELRARLEALEKEVSDRRAVMEHEMMIENADLRSNIGRLNHRLAELQMYNDKYDRSFYGRVRTAIRSVRRRIRGR